MASERRGPQRSKTAFLVFFTLRTAVAVYHSPSTRTAVLPEPGSQAEAARE
jgi:hypothetical protein